MHQILLFKGVYMNTDLTATLYTDDSEYNSMLKNDKDAFYNALLEYGFDTTDIDTDTLLPKSFIPVLAGDFNATLKFNNAILNIHRSKRTNIVEEIVFLTGDEGWFETDEIMKILQTNVLGVLTAELSAKHKLYSISPTSSINKFIH